MSRHALTQHAKRRRAVVAQQRIDTRLVDRVVYIAATLEPLATVPQAYIIFRDRTAAGVSLSAWVGFELATCIWLWYGYVHKERAILLYQGLFAITQAAVIIGGVLFGARW